MLSLDAPHEAIAAGEAWKKSWRSDWQLVPGGGATKAEDCAPCEVSPTLSAPPPSRAAPHPSCAALARPSHANQQAGTFTAIGGLTVCEECVGGSSAPGQSYCVLCLPGKPV